MGRIMTAKKKAKTAGRREGKQRRKPIEGARAASPPSTSKPQGNDIQRAVPDIGPVPAVALPAGYARLLEDIKDRIRHAQVRAAVAANRELIRLYWDIGREIVQRQEQEGWGTGVINRLAADLQASFPGQAGFSRTNIHRMRAFYVTYAATAPDVPKAVGQSSGEIVPQGVGQFPDAGRTPILPASDRASLPQAVAEIPWGHNVVLLEKLKDSRTRLWYAEKALHHGWSRAVLVHQIELNLCAREGRAMTNFDQTLPAPQSDLAQQTLKDPYVFDFLTLAEEARERELERGLLEHLRDFMLELGVGFAFVGSQYHLEIDGKDYYLDLLFYHLKLRAFVVIDLKVEEFKPEFAGKMNFYLSAVDDRLRQSDDRASIGIILCKAREKVTVEYALRDTRKPIGVSEYRLTAALPQELRSSLPTVEEFEAELGASIIGKAAITASLGVRSSRSTQN